MKITFFGIITILFVLGSAFATPQISIYTYKSNYGYGDNLSFSISVSEVTGDFATFEIIDQSGHTSSPIHVAISKLVSSITAPVPFYKTTFPPGTYYIRMQYSSSDATTSFQLIDTGKIVIPPQFKVVADSWSKGETSDKLFGEHIRTLIQAGIINASSVQNPVTFIPIWLKNDARWWSNGSISDDDFGLAIKYLVESKIIRI